MEHICLWEILVPALDNHGKELSIDHHGTVAECRFFKFAC